MVTSKILKFPFPVVLKIPVTLKLTITVFLTVFTNYTEAVDPIPYKARLHEYENSQRKTRL